MGTTKLYATLFAICAALAIGRTAGAAEASAHQWSRLTIYIGTSPFAGVGGYDTYGRVLARHIGQYLPGNPTVIPANKPGGGGMTLMNYMYNAAVQDGSEIAVVGRGVAMDRMLMGEKSNAKFDPEKFHWIGSMNKELSVFFAWQETPITLKDVLAGKAISVGAPGASSDPYAYALVMNKLLGTKLKLISGYPGMAEVQLAIEKREVDGVTGVSWASLRVDKAEWLNSGKGKVILQLGLERHPDLPDAPAIKELVTNDIDKQVMDLIFARQVIGRPLVAPPKVPADRVAVLRKAFVAAMQDKELVRESEKIGLEINWIPGEEAQALIDRVSRSPAPVVARAQEIFAN